MTSRLKKIKCQGTGCKLKQGCITCGGYKVVLQEVMLECGHQAWFRPGNYTTYEGKLFTSSDGLEMVQQNGLRCVKCAEIPA